MYPPNPKAYEGHNDPRPPSDQHIATGIPVTSAAGYNQSQPAPPLQFQPETLGPWSTGLCGCFSDVRNCCITCWCPYITFGQIAEIVDEGSMTCTTSAALYALLQFTTGHACLYACMYRTKMRQLYKLENSPCDDCLVHWCCECCALCQEYRELQSRGYDMAIGWQGINVEQKARQNSTAPRVEPGMSR